MKKIALLLVLIPSFIFAQDAHFSQFWAKPLELNPAMAGLLEGKYRLSILHRNQWKSIMGGNAFKSYVAAFDMRFKGGFGDEDSWGAGINMMNERSGTLRVGATQIGGTVAYHKYLGDIGFNGHQQISLGFSGLYSDRNVDYGSITYNDMYDETAGSYTLPTTEAFANERKTFIDFNTGVLYERYLDKRMNMYGGIVINHLTRPNIGFTRAESRLPMRMVFHAGARLPLGDMFDVQPRLLFMKQGAAMEIMYGANLRFVIDESEKETALYAGVHQRLVKNIKGMSFDALSLNVGFEYANAQIGFAYDINTSNLNKASNGRGAYEFFLIFTGGEMQQDGISCPKF